jgi:hypothetical protein
MDYGEKTQNVENETPTLFNLEDGKQHSKWWKMRNALCGTLYGEKSENHRK